MLYTLEKGERVGRPMPTEGNACYNKRYKEPNRFVLGNYFEVSEWGKCASEEQTVD